MDFVRILGKPAIVVFHTSWCPHCKNYSWLFHDPEVVRSAGQFVMIRVDRDAAGELNERYGAHGNYVPRTLVVKHDGSVDWSIQGASAEWPYFLDEYDPRELRDLMRRALALHGQAESPPASP